MPQTYSYRLEDDKYQEDLCHILHHAMSKHELETMNCRMTFGKYTVQILQSYFRSYGVWFDGSFVMRIEDGVHHNFISIVDHGSYMTPNMIEITLHCMIKAFYKYYQIPQSKRTRQSTIGMMENMMVDTEDCFTSDDIANMAEQLHGDENKDLLSYYD